MLAAPLALGASPADVVRHPGRPDPVSVRVFTPPGLPPGAYAALIRDEPIDVVVEDYRRRESLQQAWSVQPVWLLEAFDTAAPVNRYQLAQLAGATRTRLARGPIERDGRTLQMVTLISPYPDPELGAMHPGTLVLVLDVAKPLLERP